MQLARSIYDRREILVFQAAPWLLTEESPRTIQMVQFKDGRCTSPKILLSHEIQRRLAERAAWRSRRNDICYVVTMGVDGLGFGWVRSYGTIKIEEVGLSLTLDSSQVCLFDFYVDPRVRGLGVYTGFLRELRRQFQEYSCLIYAENRNIASCAGILSAGFDPLISVQGITILTRNITIGMRISQLMLVQNDKEKGVHIQQDRSRA